MSGDGRCFITRYLSAAGTAWRSFPLFGLWASFILLSFLIWADYIIKLSLLHCDVLAGSGAELEKLVSAKDKFSPFLELPQMDHS